MLPWILSLRFKKIKTAKVGTCNCDLICLRQIHLKRFIIFTDFSPSPPPFFSSCLSPCQQWHIFYFCYQLLVGYGGMKAQWEQLQAALSQLYRAGQRAVRESEGSGVCGCLWSEGKRNQGWGLCGKTSGRDTNKEVVLCHTWLVSMFNVHRRLWLSFVLYLKVFGVPAFIFLLDTYPCWQTRSWNQEVPLFSGCNDKCVSVCTRTCIIYMYTYIIWIAADYSLAHMCLEGRGGGRLVPRLVRI